MGSPCALLCAVLSFALVSRVAVSGLECPAEENGIDESFRSTPSDIVHLLVTDSADDAGYTALCHVACINYACINANGSGCMTNEAASTEGDDSMSDTLTSTGPGMLRYDCDQLKQYLDCRTGCIAQSKGQTDCADTCSGRCTGPTCIAGDGCFGFDGNPCGIGCEATDCSEGCQQFSEFPDTTLSKPTATPELTRLNSLGIYDVSIPSELDMFMEDKRSVVYRIETQPGQYVYQWKVEIDFGLPVVNLTEFLIDLRPYSGTTVNVSFAYATLSGLSAYSDPTEIGLFSEVVPVSPSDSVHRIMTDSQDKAENGAVCHATCLEFVLADMSTDENSTSEIQMENATMTDNGTMDGLNCDQLRKYLDCRTGCIAQSMGETNCADTCSGRCRALCGSGTNCFPFDANLCGAGCDSDDCDAGCQRFTQMTSDRLDAPMAPPQLQRISQNLYSLDLPTDSEMGLFSTSSPVFSIQTESNQQYYQWMVDIEISSPVSPVFITESLLDLSAFTGRRLSIAYAFATDEGISEYSQNEVVQVPEQCVEPLTTAQVQIKSRRDERAGFFVHPVLDVSWCPTPCVQEVSHYVITRNPICSDPVTETVNASASSVVLMSNSPPTSFTLPCTQTVQVQTVLIDGSTQEVTVSRILPRISGDESIPHPESLSCPISFNTERQQYQVDFKFQLPFSPAALSHIQALVIRVDELVRVEGRTDPVILTVGFDTININASVDQTVYEFTTFVNTFAEENLFYQISVEVGWMMPAGPSRDDNCRTDDAGAPPPFPIDDVTIIERNTQDVSPNDDGRTRDIEVAVRVRWSQPKLRFTPIPVTKYEVYVDTSEVSPDEENPKGTRIVDVDDERRNILDENFEGLEFNDLRTSDQTLTAYVQIRSFQYDDFPSNWSRAVEVVFVILGPQLRVPSLEIEFDTVRVEYGGNDTRLELSGEATWSQPDVDAGVRVESYQLEIESNTVADTRTLDELSTTNADFSDVVYMLRNDFTVNVTFTVTYNATLRTEHRESIPRSVTKPFRPLPPPESINVAVTNPRLVSSELSMELSISWEPPQTEGDISSYEIYVSTGDSGLRDFDFFEGSDALLKIAGNLTQFTGNFSEDVTFPDPINPSPPQVLVQMRAIKDAIKDDKLTLPKWSRPITVPLEKLQPPEITTSDITSITLTRAPGSAQFTISTEGMLSWEDDGEAEFYEVWAGSRRVEEFEEPDRTYGEIYRVDASSADVNSTLNSTTSTNSTNDNSTTPDDSTITMNISATFSGDSVKGIVHIQIRAIDPDRIPVWSTRVLSYQSPPVDPPENIEVTDVSSTVDSDAKVITVSAEVKWTVPPLPDVEGDDDGGDDVTDPTMPEEMPEASSTLSVLAVPTPIPESPSERRRRQINETGSESGSGMGSGDDGLEISQLPLGERRRVIVYMGEEVLDTFAPVPDNIPSFPAADGNAPLKMEFPLDDPDKQELQLVVQMRFESDGGIPQWSDSENVTLLPDTGEAQQEDEEDITLPVVLGVVSAVIVALLIAIAVVVFCIVKNRLKYKIITDEDDALEIYSRPGLTGIYSGKGPILDEWEISTDDVIVDELLGEGAFGEVYKGVIRGPLENPKISAVLRQAIGVPVAIKLLKYSSAGKEKSDFLAEIEMMKKIAEGYNTHIVNMVGCVTLQEPLCLITEFIPFGDLLSYLKYQRKKRSEIRRREKSQQQQDPQTMEDDGYEPTDIFKPAPYMEPANAYSHLEPKKDEPDPEPVEGSDRYSDLGDLEQDDLIRFAYQIASGMEYLASLSIVHRDLACRNVLMAKDKLLKITDFGLSREVQEVYVKKTRGRLPLKWMAIESITAREFTTSSDVWAFGIVLYEIGTIGGFPYPSINNEDLLRMLTQGYRLEKPENCSPEVYELMLHCWQEEPEERPSFSNLRSKFSAMLQAGSANPYIDLQVDEKAAYYQVKDDEGRERRDSASSGSSEGSVSSIDKQKKKTKVKRKRTNPYAQTPEQPQGQGQGEEGYIAMQSAGSALERRPTQLGIPISQLLPSSSSAAQNPDHEMTPTDNTQTPLDSRSKNPYVVEPSEALEDSLVFASPPVVEAASNGSVHESSIGPNGLTESTHL